MTEHTTESDYSDRCPKCGSRTPIGHRCIVDDLDAIRTADLSDHPLMQAIKGAAPQAEGAYTPTTETDHDWIDVPEGSGLTRRKPFRFCTRCDREEWSTGNVLPGERGHVCSPPEEASDG